MKKQAKLPTGSRKLSLNKEIDFKSNVTGSESDGLVSVVKYWKNGHE